MGRVERAYIIFLMKPGQAVGGGQDIGPRGIWPPCHPAGAAHGSQTDGFP